MYFIVKCLIRFFLQQLLHLKTRTVWMWTRIQGGSRSKSFNTDLIPSCWCQFWSARLSVTVPECEQGSGCGSASHCLFWPADSHWFGLKWVVNVFWTSLSFVDNMCVFKYVLQNVCSHQIEQEQQQPEVLVVLFVELVPVTEQAAAVWLHLVSTKTSEKCLFNCCLLQTQQTAAETHKCFFPSVVSEISTGCLSMFK